MTVSSLALAASATSVDEARKCVVARGWGTVLAKFDVEDAFHAVPVHP